jgi:hypothetical protein
MFNPAVRRRDSRGGYEQPQQGLCMACSWLVEEVDDADPDAHASG